MDMLGTHYLEEKEKSHPCPCNWYRTIPLSQKKYMVSHGGLLCGKQHDWIAIRENETAL